MRCQRSIAVCGSRVRTESVLHGNLCIVKDHPPGCSSKVLKGLYQSIQKALTVLPAVRNNKRCIAIAKTGTEQVHDYPLSSQHDSCFTPVNLDCISGGEFQREKCFFHIPSDRADIGADCGFTASKALLLHQSVIDPSGGVVLLGGAFLLIGFQALGNKGFHFRSQYAWCPRVYFSFPWNLLSLTVLPDSVTGYPHRSGDTALTFTVQAPPSYFLVDVHCNNHL